MKLDAKLEKQAKKTAEVLYQEVEKKVLGIHKVLLHTKAMAEVIGVDSKTVAKYFPDGEELDKISTPKKFEKFIMKDLIKPIAEDIERNLKNIKKAIRPEIEERIECVKKNKKYKNVNGIEQAVDYLRDSVEDKVQEFLNKNNLGREISKLIEAMKDQIVSIIESLEKSVSGLIRSMEKDVSKTKTHEQELDQKKGHKLELTRG